MPFCLTNQKSANAIPIIPVNTDNFTNWCSQQDASWQRWLQSINFTAKANSVCLLPDVEQQLAAVIIGIDEPLDTWSLANLPTQLPAGQYYVDADWSTAQHEQTALGWALQAYQFDRYKQAKPIEAELALAAGCDLAAIKHQYEATALVRDLINTPAEDMMPEQLAQAVADVANTYSAEFSQLTGAELLENNYPTVHAVGRASSNEPRLLDMHWGDPAHPKLTLVGKGVCFDSGGLDLKSANGMRLMKKDMGGAAHALGLASLIMASGLPVRLRVLIAAVENAVAGNAFRPGDVIRTRQGLTVEIDNTDAEGRLILCDALTEGATEQPDLMIDFATLTGAARIAVGTEVAAFFTDADEIASQLMTCSATQHDPVWRLPLHKPYRQMLDSKIADIVNSASSGYAGATTAALFLQEFVPDSIPWLHFDLMAWNTRSRPGRPEGGEAMGVRAVFNYLQQHFVT